jgi:hypothetical protein
MAYRKRGGGGRANVPKTWFAPGSTAIVGAIAAGAQVTITDYPIIDPVTSDAYPSGRIVGLRMWISILTGAIGGHPVTDVVCMVLKNGEAVPSILTYALRTNNQDKIWWLGQLNPVTAAGPQVGMFHLGTPRSFDRNDRLVLVAVNREGVVWGAAASFLVTVDSYLTAA